MRIITNERREQKKDKRVQSNALCNAFDRGDIEPIHSAHRPKTLQCASMRAGPFTHANTHGVDAARNKRSGGCVPQVDRYHTRTAAALHTRLLGALPQSEDEVS